MKDQKSKRKIKRLGWLHYFRQTSHPSSWPKNSRKTRFVVIFILWTRARRMRTQRAEVYRACEWETMKQNGLRIRNSGTPIANLTNNFFVICEEWKPQHSTLQTTGYSNRLVTYAKFGYACEWVAQWKQFGFRSRNFGIIGVTQKWLMLVKALSFGSQMHASTFFQRRELRGVFKSKIVSAEQYFLVVVSMKTVHK